MATAPSGPPPTLREIARQAKVSHTTVSLALHHPSIPEETRERLHRLADRLGYRSNVLISALMSQVRLKHTKLAPEVIGFLTGGRTADDWKNHSASVGYYDGARRRAQQLGMRVEPFWLGEGGRNAPETCRMLHVRAIRGNLLAPFPIPIYDHALDWPKLICVGLGYVYNRHALHRATHNHFRAAYLAYENATRLGYTRIGLMLGADENRRVNYSWLGGFLAAQNTLGSSRLAPCVTDDIQDHKAIRAWLRRAKPDVVIGFGPNQLSSLLQVGYKVPGDIAFAALDVAQTRLAHVEKVAGIDQNLPMVGATAIDMLAGQLYQNEEGLPQRPVLSMIDGVWVDGRTAPKV